MLRNRDRLNYLLLYKNWRRNFWVWGNRCQSQIIICCHVSLLSLSDCLFQILSRRIESCPIRFLVIRIWDEFWTWNFRENVWFLNSCGEIFGRSWIEDFDIWIEFLCSFNNYVKIHINIFSILIAEVISHRDQKLWSRVMVSSFFYLLHKFSNSCLKIVWIHKSLVVYDERILEIVIKFKSLRTPIHIVCQMSNQFIALIYFPLKLEFLLLSQLLLQIVRSSRKYEIIKSHLLEQVCLSKSMPKLIKMPSHFRSDLKLILQKLMTCLHIGDDVFIVTNSFIIQTPASVDEFELAIFNKISELFFWSLCLLVPPFRKESHFCPSEGSVLVLFEHVKNSVENVIHASSSYHIFWSGVVLVDCLSKSNIVMGMGN